MRKVIILIALISLVLLNCEFLNAVGGQEKTAKKTVEQIDE